MAKMHRWTPQATNSGTWTFLCSDCGERSITNFKFCPFCGAKMNGIDVVPCWDCFYCKCIEKTDGFSGAHLGWKYICDKYNKEVEENDYCSWGRHK